MPLNVYRFKSNPAKFFNVWSKFTSTRGRGKGKLCKGINPEFIEMYKPSMDELDVDAVLVTLETKQGEIQAIVYLTKLVWIDDMKSTKLNHGESIELICKRQGDVTESQMQSLWKKVELVVKEEGETTMYANIINEPKLMEAYAKRGFQLYKKKPAKSADQVWMYKTV